MELRALKLAERSAWRFSDDWSKDDDRLAVMSLFAARAGLKMTSRVGMPPHGRSITLEFEGGKTAQVLLDQGFGAWSTTSAPRFVFNEAPVRQVAALASADFRIAARGMTYVVGQMM